MSCPGTHINSFIVNGCLQYAKKNKMSYAVVMLHISKSYDNIGHDHLESCLQVMKAPKVFCSLIMNLVRQNTIKLQIDNKFSNEIKVNRGVAQRSPLAPLLFNISINFVLNELCDFEIANEFGFKINSGTGPTSILAFADDLALICKDLNSATFLVSNVISLLQEIGLSVNLQKSCLINIVSGVLNTNALSLMDGSQINSLKQDKTIKYLGSTFSDEIVLDNSVINNVHKNVEHLCNSLLLNNDQQINILNQYLLLMLIFHLQSTPMSKLKVSYLEDVDCLIRRTVKDITGTLAKSSSSMIYAPRKYRGLGMIRMQWEARIQHFNIARNYFTLTMFYIF